MKNPYALLRTLSARIPSSLSSLSPVAPRPVRRSFDRRIALELNALRQQCRQPECFTSAIWLLRVLEFAVTTQKIAMDSLNMVDCCNGDRRVVDDYLDDVIELLDACNSLRERIDVIMSYVGSLRVALHCLDGESEPNEAALARARGVLGKCEVMERRCAELEKCSSSLRKLGEKLAHGSVLGKCGRKVFDETSMSKGSEFDEALSGSKAVALVVCGMLVIALSFKSKRGLPTMQSLPTGYWSSSLHELNKEVKEEIDSRRKTGGMVLNELRRVTETTQNLRDLIVERHEKKACSGELRATIETLERRCVELEEGVKPFEGKINELYRHLISIRISLLDRNLAEA